MIDLVVTSIALVCGIGYFSILMMSHEPKRDFHDTIVDEDEDEEI